MAVKGFSKEDFEVLTIPGLDDRMEGIRNVIQPKFREIGSQLTDDLSIQIGEEMYLHIAKHARRTVNPPKDTWLAIGPNKRGYKQYPHFQVGLFDDYVFLWLAYIYELPNKAQIAQKLLNHLDEIKTLVPADFSVSLDHMQKGTDKISDIDLQKALERFKDIKKAEFLIGRIIPSNDPVLKNGDKFMELTRQTFKTLLPIYKISINH